MQMFSFAALTLFASCVLGQVDLGDRLVRTYTEYITLPVTTGQALQNSWEQINGGACVEGLGFGYRKDGEAQNATILYFDLTGKVSGISVDVFGSPPPANVIAKGYYVEVSNKRYRISVAFRDPASVCSSTNSMNAIGDRLIINPSSLNKSLPLTADQAVQQGWYKGSCFHGMGRHYFYDLAAAPNMTWSAENLLPVVTMFNNDGAIQSIFFASWTVQESVLHSVDWEPVPLTNGLMCDNFCDAKCTFSGTDAWSTYHIYFKDLELATCANNCKIHCCP